MDEFKWKVRNKVKSSDHPTVFSPQKKNPMQPVSFPLSIELACLEIEK